MEEKTGTTWFDLLQSELELIGEEDLIDPGEPIGNQEEIIGEMTLKQKKLYTLVEKMSKELDELVVEAKYAPYEKRDNYIVQIEELREKLKVLVDLFYISIKDHFDLWEKMPKWAEKNVIGIGLRTGFKVVKIKGKGSLADFLRRFIE